VASGLTLRHRRELEDSYGSLDDAVAVAFEHPVFGGQLHGLGVRVVRTMGGLYVHIPAGKESRCLELVWAAHAESAIPPKRARRRKVGRRDKPVSNVEANRAARIYVKDRTRTPYDVHELYKREIKNGDPPAKYDAKNGAHLSRSMVGHLINAIDEEWLSWDVARKELRISDEFLTSTGKFVIPRSEPARRAKT
jgi:hypothetical protein